MILISNEMNGIQIIGHFDQLKNQIIKLEGYHGFNTYTIDSVHIDDNGNFLLSYNENNIGIGSRIIIIRSGDVIPYIKEVLSPSTDGKPLMPNVKFIWNKKDIILDDDNKMHEKTYRNYKKYKDA